MINELKKKKGKFIRLITIVPQSPIVEGTLKEVNRDYIKIKSKVDLNGQFFGHRFSNKTGTIILNTKHISGWCEK